MPGTGRGSLQDLANGVPVYIVTNETPSSTTLIQGMVTLANKSTWPENGRTGIAAIDAPTGGDLTTTGFASNIVAPAAPVTSISSSGGSLAAGNYLASLTFTNAAGETVCGTDSGTLTTSGATSSITFTAPVLPPGVTGYNVYVSTVGGGTGTEVKQNASPIAQGTNFVLTSLASLGAKPGGTTTGVGLQDFENAISCHIRATCTVASKNLTGFLVFYDANNNPIGVSENIAFLSNATLRLGNAAGDFVSQRQIVDVGTARKAKFFASTMDASATWAIYTRPM